MAEHGKFGRLYEELKAGRLSRRQFIQRATALGVATPVVLFILQATKGVGGAAAAPAAQAAGTRPTAGTEGQTRGAGGELRVIQWQAATILGQHQAVGTKDSLASSLVSEPLMNYMPDGSLVPNLVKEVPSVENGLLAEDLRSVTYNLLEGVTWSDGQPFTARDVAFTWSWITDEANQATDIVSYQVIEAVEAVDDLTVRITFAAPQLPWYVPFTGNYLGAVYPEHVLGANPEAIREFNQKPIGTGPYTVESFAPGDQVVYVMNQNYREPNKPFFERVNMKGGGDAASAARAVLQTGDYDVAWNLQVEQAILDELMEGGKGIVDAPPGNSVERIMINFSDPRKEVNGQRSEKNTPHPFLTDKAVREAMAMACNREAIATQFYAETEPPTRNILTGTAYDSPNKDFVFDVERAKQVLEDAGWTMDGDVRAKDGVELRLTYSTSINNVRQRTQAVIKQAWEELGIAVQLKQVPADSFFDSSPGNEQAIYHFYEDILMYTDNPTEPFPLEYMQGWYAGPEGENISQAENGWSRTNLQRYSNPEYDALIEELEQTADLERAAEIFVQLNEILITDSVVIPLVQRAAEKTGLANTFRQENLAAGAFDTLYWNIANWNRVEG